VAKLLFDRGYKKVRPLLGGFDGWKEAGYPVEFLTISAKRTSLVTDGQ
jgi:rhodanese-related sulfurtransferase